jgi:hypothetical protein
LSPASPLGNPLEENSKKTLEWTSHASGFPSLRTFGVTADALGHVYVVGQTSETLTNRTKDAIVSKFDRDGTLQWTKEFGTSSKDFDRDVTTDSWETSMAQLERKVRSKE